MSEAMRQEIEQLKAVNRRIFAALLRMEEKMATKDDLKGLEDRVYNRLDDLAAICEDTRERVTIHASLLEEHARRLKKPDS